MFFALKIIHFFCLFGGGAAMMGNGILMRKVMASGAPPAPLVADTMKRLGRIGLMSIVLLWLTGIAMVLTADLALGWQFYAKLVAAALTLAGSSGLALTAAKAERDGVPPDAQRMKNLSILTSLGAAVAVIFAVLAFN